MSLLFWSAPHCLNVHVPKPAVNTLSHFAELRTWSIAMTVFISLRLHRLLCFVSEMSTANSMIL